MFILKTMFRLVSFLLLIAAVVIAVLDAVRSVATTKVDVLSTYTALQVYAADTIPYLSSQMDLFLHPNAWRVVSDALIFTPLTVFLLIASLLCWLIGYKKHQSPLRIFAAIQ